MFENRMIDGIKRDSNDILPEIVKIRRHIHKHPEIGFDTKKTEELIKNFLIHENIKIIPSDMGVYGYIRGCSSEKIIALRADMDALCLQEENNVAYKSLYANRMHACGHDGHTAMLLGAAKLLNNRKNDLPYDILLIFQPAEEGPNLGGARIMLAELEEKLFAKKIARIFALHLTTNCPTGTINTKSGSMAASTDEFCIKIIGKGGHAGEPHRCVDALSIGVKIIIEMESFMSRCINPFDSAVFSVGMFNSGSARNIVAETAKIEGTLRCQSEPMREYILNKMESIATGICDAFDAKGHIEILHGLPPLFTDIDSTDFSVNVGRCILGEKNVHINENPMMGAEDFAYFAKKIPASFIWIGAGNEEKGLIHAAHSPKFDFDEEALAIGVQFLCGVALSGGGV